VNIFFNGLEPEDEGRKSFLILSHSLPIDAASYIRRLKSASDIVLRYWSRNGLCDLESSRSLLR